MLRLEHVKKKFGEKEIIKDLSFSVPKGEVFGFIGQNGAGKTTTMKMILGLLKSDGGEIFVNEKKVEYGQNKTNQYIGYLPDVPEFYPYMKPMEYLRLCGEITGMDRKHIQKRSEELLEMVGLEKEHKRIGGFSRGMKQRLGIAQALLNSPKLLICDEPTSALDPIGRKEILDILVKGKEETTIIFSTHILSDVERICDSIAVLNDGKAVMQGTLSEIRKAHKKDSLSLIFNSEKEVKEFLADSAIRDMQEKKVFLVEHAEEKEKILLHTRHLKNVQGEAFKACTRLECYPKEIVLTEPTLESVFMEVVNR